MALVHLYIEDSESPGKPGQLWRRDYPFADGAVPRKGERIILFDWDGEIDDGPFGYVSEVYWATNGWPIIDLDHMVIDPVGYQADRPLSSIPRPWHSPTEGDLVAYLELNGWTKQ